LRRSSSDLARETTASNAAGQWAVEECASRFLLKYTDFHRKSPFLRLDYTAFHQIFLFWSLIIH
jgi:hypothetical protein